MLGILQPIYSIPHLAKALTFLSIVPVEDYGHSIGLICGLDFSTRNMIMLYALSGVRSLKAQ